MPNATIVGVVYSPNQKIARRVIISDESDSHVLYHRNNMVAGEQFMTIPMDIFKTFTHPDHLRDHISNILGGEVLSSKCVVVDSHDNIVASLHADPRIDDHPQGHIIQDDEAIGGLKYDLINAKVLK